jgi:hypothetical protein
MDKNYENIDANASQEGPQSSGSIGSRDLNADEDALRRAILSKSATIHKVNQKDLIEAIDELVRLNIK